VWRTGVYMYLTFKSKGSLSSLRANDVLERLQRAKRDSRSRESSGMQRQVQSHRRATKQIRANHSGDLEPPYRVHSTTAQKQGDGDGGWLGEMRSVVCGTVIARSSGTLRA
jgi:hypothetical protein